MPKMKVCTENSSLKQLKRVCNTLNKDFSLGQCIKLCKIVCLWKQKGTLLATFYHYIHTHPYLSAFQTCLETSLFRLGINFPSRYPWSILVSSFVIADCNFCSTCATHLMDFTLFKKKKKAATSATFLKLGSANFITHPSVMTLDLMKAVVIVPLAPEVSRCEPSIRGSFSIQNKDDVDSVLFTWKRFHIVKSLL